MNAAARAAAVAFAIAVLGWVAVEAFEAGVAGTIAFESSQQLNSLAAAPSKAIIGGWSRTHERLLAAANLEPSDPAVHELLGVIDMQRDGSQEYLAEADVHFAKALELRPTSAYTWSNLAAVKYRLGDTGPLFEKALVHAAAMGPYEPEVQRNVAHLGLAVWSEVGPETRAAIEAMVAAGMRRNPAELLQIAQRRGRLAIACRHLAGFPRQTDSKWSQLCQSTEATS